jgi:hypothetical protein
MVESPTTFELIGVAVEEIGRLLRLAQGLHPVLPDFQGEGGRDVKDPLLDELPYPAQVFGAFSRRRLLPLCPCALRG